MATRSSKPEAASGGGEERSPEQIEAEIEATREELGDTVAELADKADVKKQAKKKAAETKAKATAKAEEVKEKAAAQAETAKAKAPDAARDGAQQATQGAQRATAQAAEWARENPIPAAAIAAFAAGLLVGWIAARR
jgi:ElaB/YqjD/DUF883 family membrane-anchored ribosome-binding protein